MEDVTSADSVEARLDAVERLLGELIEHLGDEVKTRRLVVVEDDGFERVILAAAGHHGEVMVAARNPGGGTTAAELYAHDAAEGDGSHAGVAVINNGDIAAVIEAMVGRGVVAYGTR
jgi:hypothetical protein